MSTQHDRPPMCAKDAESGTGASVRAPRRDVGEVPVVPPDAEPEALVERILGLLSKSHYREARDLAAAALARFPDHERVQWAWDIFEIRGKATVSEEGPEPSKDQEAHSVSRFKTTLREHLPRLAEQYHVGSLGLFGSYVRQEQSEASDLDVLVEFTETPGLFSFVDLENELSDLLGVRVDLVMRDALKPRLRPRILAEVVTV